MTRNAQHVTAILFCTLGVAAAAAQPAAQDVPAWQAPSVVTTFARLPVQDEGRVKPLDTVAGVKLLKFNGKRKCKTPDGGVRRPSAWLLDVLFSPETAMQYKMFRVEDSDVLMAAGLPAARKRDRYSYHDLAPARDRLMELGRLYAARDARLRSSVENQLVGLAQNLREFEMLAGYLDFARTRYAVPENPWLRQLFGARQNAPFSEVLDKAPQLTEKFMALRRGAGPGAETPMDPDFAAISTLLHELDAAASDATALALFPPGASGEEAWLTPADLVTRVFSGEPLSAQHRALLMSLERLVTLADDAAGFAEEWSAFSTALVAQARQRGEYGKIGLEAAYYRVRFFHYGLMLYLLSVAVVAVSWIRPRNRLLTGAAAASVVAPTALVICGIVFRCIIRGRPPVTTLYETILFITAVVVTVSLFMEWVNRQRVGLALGSFLGVLGLFLANKYEMREGADTMQNMVAVLDTNFWLALHVTTIVIGYAAALLAGALGHVYVLAKLAGFRRRDPGYYRGLARMTYGVLCAALLFSVVGTVLGGIWASESWGRFWGWDPKENGALLIVLWLLIVLHARLGGIIGEFGVVLSAIFADIVVGFSWFGVNLLGVGLHSYGFTSGIFRALLLFYIVEFAVLMLGAAVWLRERGRRREQGTYAGRSRAAA